MLDMKEATEFHFIQVLEKRKDCFTFSRLCSQKMKGLSLRGGEESKGDAVDVHEKDQEQEHEIAEMVDAFRVA